MSNSRYLKQSSERRTLQTHPTIAKIYNCIDATADRKFP
jgi:hypothetical protein